jgi:hypothetical protein
LASAAENAAGYGLRKHAHNPACPTGENRLKSHGSPLPLGFIQSVAPFAGNAKTDGKENRQVTLHGA